MDVMKKVPVREQAPDVRNKNFDEVCLGYNKEEAMEEATRCLNCKNARCVQGCPVSIDIPAFIHQVKEGNIEEAYKIIGKSSALPAVCGRVCPQETQCEGQCIRGIKGESVSIEKLEAMTCVCSVGLGMIAIPGDTPATTISGIIADEAAIGMVNQKTTAVRGIPLSLQYPFLQQE